ncbi:MAG: diguanylate cyclase [Chloroflexota bacterium]
MPRLASNSFAADLLNSLTAHIAVLNSQGDIVAVNDAWRQFAHENNCPDKHCYFGANYLQVCEQALKGGQDKTVEAAWLGIRALLYGEKDDFTLEYPCHSPTEERWYILRATRFEHKAQTFVVVSHENATNRRKIEVILAESREHFRTLTQSLPDTIYTFEPAQRRLTYFNRDSFLGYSREELVVSGSIMQNVHPEDISVLRSNWQSMLEGKSVEGVEYRIKNKAGQWEWIDSRQIVLSRNPDGTPKEIMVILRLITDRQQAVEQIAYHARLLDNVNDVIIGTDEAFCIKYWNRAAERILGWQADEVIGKPTSDVLRTKFLGAQDDEALKLLTETGVWKGEVIQFTKDGKPLVIEANVMTVRDHAGQITGYVSANRDITEKKQAQERLAGAYKAIEIKNQELEQAVQRAEQLARNDGLTGIFNHRHFMEIASYEFAMAQRYKHTISILIFDVDKFKQVNDTMGHLFGDEVLRQIAQITKARLRETDVLARYGGEEFIVLLPNTNPHEAYVVAEAIRESIATNKFQGTGGHVHTTVSIGIAGILVEEHSIERLIHRADEALYQAKAAGRNCTRLWTMGGMHSMSTSELNVQK